MATIGFINIFEGQEGGGEVYLSTLIDSLASRFPSNTYLLFTPTCPAFSNLKHKCLTIIPITGIRKTNFFENLKRFLKTVKNLNNLLRKYPIEILIINGERAVYLSPFLKTRARKIGVRHMLIDTKLKGIISDWSFKGCDTIVTISNFHKENFLKHISSRNRNKVVVIYNGVDIRKFTYSPIFKTYPQTITFIQVGTLEKRKGPLDTLNAFIQLRKKNTLAKLIFVGKGPEEGPLKAIVHSLKMESDVLFLGYRNDLPMLLASADVLLLPSYNEGLPLSILEAFSIGRPVIASNIAGIPEIIKDENNGFLLKAGDINDITSKMLLFCNNPDQIAIFGKNGREVVEKTFNQQQWLNNWTNILNFEG